MVRDWYRSLVVLVILSLILPFGGYEIVRAAPVKQYGTSAWLDTQEKNGIVYFLYSAPAQIRRYNMAGQAWLADIPLAAAPNAFWVDDMIYVALDTHVQRISLDGLADSNPLATVSGTISRIITGGDYLFVYYPSGYYQHRLQSMVKSTGEFIDEETINYSFDLGLAIAPSLRKIYGTFGSGSTIYMEYNADGTLTPNWASTNNASSSYYRMSPDESYLIHRGGTVFNTIDLSLRLRILAPDNYHYYMDDVTFYGDEPVISWSGYSGEDSYITGYSNSFLQQGTLNLKNVPKRIFIQGKTLFAFSESQPDTTLGTLPEVIVETQPIDRLLLDPPGMLVDPVGLDFLPDDSALGQGDILYLLSRKYQSVFRWSISGRAYLESIPLAQVPERMVYMSANNSLYLAYQNGQISTIHLDISPAEQAFMRIADKLDEFVAADDLLFMETSPRQGGAHTYKIISASGEILYTRSNENGFYRAWNGLKRRLYGVGWTDGHTSISWMEVGPDGMLGTSFFPANHPDSATPLRINQAGTQVLDSFGHLYDGDTLLLQGTLPNSISDGAWINEALYTARPTSANTQVQLWSSSNTVLKTCEVAGLPLRLMAVPGGLLVLANKDGRLLLHLVDQDLNVLVSPPKASFSYYVTNDVSGIRPLAVNFINRSTNGPISTYLWDFGDGETSNEANPVHVYNWPGIYQAKLVVTGPGGQDGVIQDGSIWVRPMEAKFSAAPDLGKAPLEVTFSDQSAGGPFDTYLWNFGDGQTSSLANPTHTYLLPGNYPVTLTVASQYGSATATTQIIAQGEFKVFAPFLSTKPQYLQPGLYTFDLCKNFPLWVNWHDVGGMTECVQSIEVLENGQMKFNYTWRYRKNPWINECLTKYADTWNTNMYVTDGANLRYDHISVGGAAAEDIYCVESGPTYTGWFLFPSADSPNGVFTFHDADVFIQIGPLPIPVKK